MAESRGILLIATGHRNYTRMAVTLAATIRMVDMSISICLAGNYQELPPEEKALFTDFVDIPKKYHTLGTNTEAWIKTKVHLDQLSPYKETLFLDVDQVWLWKTTPTQTFELLSQHEWVIENTGYVPFDNYIYPASENWCDMKEVQEGYGFKDEHFYKVHSEFIYFKKTKKVEELFKKIREVYTKPKVKPQVFAGAYPDEFAFAIAMSLTGTYPEIGNYCPTYWQPRDNSDKYIYQIATDYLTLSIGGSFVDEASKENYNNVAKRAFNELELINPYQITKFNDKRRYLPERKSS